MIKELQAQVGSMIQENETLAVEVHHEEQHRAALKRQLHVITSSLAYCVKENQALKNQHDSIREFIQVHARVRWCCV